MILILAMAAAFEVASAPRAAGRARWLAALAGLALGLLAIGPASAGTAAAPSPPTPSASAPVAVPPTHRPLRSNLPPAAPNPTEPEVFAGYPDAPAFTVVPRRQHLALFPCSQCHKLLPPNPQPRKLVAAPHQASLAHGRGRFWCLDCHVLGDRDSLHTVNGAKVDFNDSHQVCGACHGARHRDWAHGAHGKRVAGWQGPRELYACTHCHDPHNPVLAPRAPSKPPPLRAGLQAMQPQREPHPMPWQRPSQGPTP